MGAFAEHFRVIAPDLRGCGGTVNPGGGSIRYAQLVDDALGLIAALGLDRPLICGFSDGATLATILGVRRPESVGAIVNHAGYDLLNPQAPSFTMARQFRGGSPDATEADPAERFLESVEQMRPMPAGMRAEHGDGWKRILTQMFERITTSPGHIIASAGSAPITASHVPIVSSPSTVAAGSSHSDSASAGSNCAPPRRRAGVVAASGPPRRWATSTYSANWAMRAASGICSPARPSGQPRPSERS